MGNVVNYSHHIAIGSENMEVRRDGNAEKL
jgi:hypothetical protein